MLVFKHHRKSQKRKTFALVPASIAFISLECTVLAQAFFAYRDGMLTVMQMRQRGIVQGLPFVWHFAMWTDLLIISGLVAYIIGRYLRHWHRHQILGSLLIGICLSAIMHWTYTFSDMSEAHVQNHQLTGAGVVHFFYMAMVITVLTQFFLFTKDVPSKLLTVTSILVSFQVFIGTHMALGIITTISPLDWYPAQPLKNYFGWTIFAAVVISLAWYRLGTIAILNMLKDIYRLGLWIVNQKPDKPEGYLKFLDWFGDLILTIGFFGNFAVLWWRQQENPFSIALIIVIGGMFYLSRLSVKQELEIGESLFPPDRVPDDLKPKDRLTIGLQVILYFAVYMLLGWVAKYIVVASLGLLVIACIDFNGRRLIDKKMRRYFSNTEYAPDPNERMYETIQARRSVTQWYLFDLPQWRKDSGKVAGCAIALCIATFGYFAKIEWVENLAYITLIGTLILNEVFAMKWRLERDRRLNILQYLPA